MSRSNLVRPHDVCGASRRRLSAVLCALVAFGLGTPAAAVAQEALLPGQAFVTQFSGTTSVTGADGVARTVIDVNGASGVAIDLRAPGFAPDGRHWIGEPHLFAATAGDVGQVFGVALDDAAAPNIYLTATALFGLHRSLDNSGWMEGMWGRGGGPGTVYKLNAANGYRPEVFAEIALNGRPNSGAALGNIAFDRWNRQFYVSDLETGMIHRIGLADGADLGRYDHGVSGRSSFFDAVGGVAAAFAPVAFDPATAARIFDCPTGDIARTVSCWNMADFRRRVFGLGVRRDAAAGEVRLYYAVWGSQGFGNLAWATAGDDRRNTLWSVAIGPDGDFDLTSVRREAMMPDFFVAPEDIARAGFSHPVADVAFPAFGDQTVMLLAERGGVRNLGLTADNAFANTNEARVLRYQRDPQGTWQLAGRYDVGFYDRQADGPPYIRANAAGGVTFGFGYDSGGAVDLARPDSFVWMTGDALCSPGEPCFNPVTGSHDDQAEVHGVEGRDQAMFEPVVPDAAFRPYPAPGPATPASGPDSAFMIDSNVDADAAGNLIADLSRNDATRIGDIAVYEIVPDPAVRPVAGPWYGPWDGDWPWPVPAGDYPPLPAPPPGEAWPELALEKTAPPECAPTEPCTVTITTTNNGPGVYQGPLHVLDTPEGLILAEHSAGWTCEQPVLGGAIGCRSDWVTLAPRESVALDLTLGWPGVVVADGEGDVLEFQNCGFIVWPQALEGAARIRAVEAALLLLDFDPGAVDGVYDADTQAAIDAYRRVAGMPPGEIDDALLASLFPGTSAMAGDGVPDNDRSCAPIRIPLGTEEANLVELRLEKEDHSLNAEDCRPGGTCRFVLRIFNEGSAPFDGPFIAHDKATVLGVGQLPAERISAANPVWSCTPATADVARCEPDAGTLQLTASGGGDNADAAVIHVTLPDDIEGDELENCLNIAWDEMAFPGGRDGDDTNDDDCIVVPIVRGEEPAGPEEDAGPEAPEGVPEAAELQLVKDRPWPTGCQPGGTCEFLITVTNLGGSEYVGPVAFTDDASLLGGDSLPVGSVLPVTPGLNCFAVPGVGTSCRHADALTIAADGGFVHFEVSVTIPEEGTDGQTLHNCAEIAWDTMDFPGGRDADSDNDDGCADIAIGEAAVAANFDLEVFKRGPIRCATGQWCDFTISIWNQEGETFEGPLSLHELAGATREGHDSFIMNREDAFSTSHVRVLSEGWECDDSGDYLICRKDDVSLREHYSTQVQVSVGVPNDFPQDRVLTNCVRLGTVAGEAGPLANEVCASVPVFRHENVDLAINKDAADGLTCRPGGQCEFRLWLGNEGSEDFVGRLVFDDWSSTVASNGISTALPATAITSAGEFDCTEVADGTRVRRCSQDRITLEGGSTDFIPMFVNVPDSVTGGVVENCASIVWDEMDFPGHHDLYPGNDGRVCATVPIAGDPVPDPGPAEFPDDLDLRVEKRAPDSCERGVECEFVITAVNDGPGRYNGPLVVRDDLPADAGDALGTRGGWECNLKSDNLFCLPFEPVERFEPKELTLLWDVPDDYPLGRVRNCAEIEWVRQLPEDSQRRRSSVEFALWAAGFDPGEIDGLYDEDTSAAIRAYREGNDLPAGEGVDEDLLNALFPDTAGLEGDRLGSNDRDCDFVEIIEGRRFDIQLTIVPEAADCRPDGRCQYRVNLQNFGPESYDGPLAIQVWATDPVGSERLGYTFTPTADWSCGHAGDEGAMWCRRPVSDMLGADAVQAATITVALPGNIDWPGLALHAEIEWGMMGRTGDENGGNDSATAIQSVIYDGPDLGTGGGTECQRGEECEFEVTIDNHGNRRFTGAAGIRGMLDPAVEITRVEPLTEGLICSATGLGSYECLGTKLVIEPGEAARINIRAAIPADFAAEEITHTKDMVWPDAAAKDRNPENDQNVTTITIEGPEGPQQVAAPDLAVDKIAGRGSCVAGQACPFTVAVSNIGPGTYAGPIRIADVVAAANAQLSASPPSPWSCRRSGGTITCTYPSAMLAAGESIRLPLSLTPSRTATGSFNNCASLAWNDTTRTAIVQNALNQLGLDAGTVDGKIGPRTRGAVRAYEERAGLPATGRIDPALLESMFGTWATGDANAANDEDCAGVVLQTPAAPTIACDGGTISNNQCICPAGLTRQQVATHAWRCVAPQPVVTCVGGTIQGDKCACPTGTVGEQFGANAWRCVATTPSQITCAGGSVVNNQCACPEGTLRRQTATNSWRCVRQAGPSVPPIVPQLTCQGGTIQQGQCVCPAGEERKQILPGVFRCETVAPSIQCGGGRIENNRCVCPQGMEVQQRAPNVYKCVAPAQAPSIQCSGGTVENNQCVCPQGMRPRKVSDRVYRCVKSEAPSQAPPAATAPAITCTGGSVQNGKCICPVGTRRQQTATNAYRCAPLVQGPLQRIVPRLLHK